MFNGHRVWGILLWDMIYGTLFMRYRFCDITYDVSFMEYVHMSVKDNKEIRHLHL